MNHSVNDVAIIGAGLHPFGRFEGKSAMEMAADAIQLALADVGVEWKDIQFAVGGSWTVANPDATRHRSRDHPDDLTAHYLLRFIAS